MGGVPDPPPAKVWPATKRRAGKTLSPNVDPKLLGKFCQNREDTLCLLTQSTCPAHILKKWEKKGTFWDAAGFGYFGDGNLFPPKITRE